MKIIITIIITLQNVIVNVGDDCPAFDGLLEYCQRSTGGSLGQ